MENTMFSSTTQVQAANTPTTVLAFQAVRASIISNLVLIL